MTEEDSEEELIDDIIPDLISFTQAEEIYGLTGDYLGELARKGRLTAKKIGFMWVTTPKNVENFLRSRQRRGSYRDDVQPLDD